MGKMIFLNGLLYHGSNIIISNNNIIKLLKYWDVSFNIFSAIYVNYTTAWQPYNYLLTLISLTAWQVNRLYFKNNKLIHLFLVQDTLCLASYYY